MRKTAFYTLLATLAVLLLVQCSVYYNTMFNAEQLFAEAQEIEPRDNGMIDHNARTKYDSAMKKCGWILTEHKNSEWADDALYLLARCLYYKRSYMQAEERFSDLLRIFPQNPFIADTKLYLAKCQYELNRHEDAFADLREILANPDFAEKHSEVLLLLANWQLEQEEFTMAEANLRKLIEQYPDSEEYEEAYVSLGQVFRNQKSYQQSNQVINDLLKSKVERSLKLDARIIRADNNLLLGNLNEVEAEIKQLLEDEYRPAKISAINLLRARLLENQGETEKVLELYGQILDENSRNELAAEANYWLGQFYFYTQHNYKDAENSYKAVGRSSRDSKFAPLADAQQIITRKIIDHNSQIKGAKGTRYADLTMSMAELYLNTMALPDSAFALYDSLQVRSDSLAILRQQLLTRLDVMQYKADSLAAYNDSLTAYNDSLAAADTLAVDDVKDETDNKPLAQGAIADGKQETENVKAEADTLANKQPAPVVAPANNTSTQQVVAQVIIPPPGASKADIESAIAGIEALQDKYNTEYLPFTWFVRVWANLAVKADTLAAQQAGQMLTNNWPDSRYTVAAQQALAGQEPDFLTPAQRKFNLDFNKAVEDLVTEPRQTIANLQQLDPQDEPDQQARRLYAIGAVYWYELKDSLNAATWFEQLAEEHPKHDLTQKLVSYGMLKEGKLRLLDRLPALVSIEEEKAQARADSLAAAQALADSLAAADSLAGTNRLENTEDERDQSIDDKTELEPDTSNIDNTASKADSLAAADSLQHNLLKFKQQQQWVPEDMHPDSMPDKDKKPQPGMGAPPPPKDLPKNSPPNE